MEDGLEKILSLFLSVFWFELDLKMGYHFPDGFFVVVHDVSAESDDWLHDELNEASLESGSIISCFFHFPFLGFGIEEVVSPKFLHHLVVINLELVSIDSGKSGKGEGPTKKSRTEGDGTFAWVDLLSLSHIISFVS